MLINTHATGFELTDAIRRHADWRVESALGWAAGWIDQVSIRLVEAGHNDMTCRIRVRLRLDRSVVVEATHGDLYLAINNAATKLREAVLREVRRYLTVRRNVRYGLRPSFTWN